MPLSLQTLSLKFESSNFSLELTNFPINSELWMYCHAIFQVVHCLDSFIIIASTKASDFYTLMILTNLCSGYVSNLSYRGLYEYTEVMA